MIRTYRTSAGSIPQNIIEFLNESLTQKSIGEDIRLSIEFGTVSRGGSSLFFLFLDTNEFGISEIPVITATYRPAISSGSNSVEVLNYNRRIIFPLERIVEIPEAIEIEIFRKVASLVSPGGKLIVEYDSVDHRLTAEALSSGVPSAATPLGGMMLAIGCGVQFINHDLSGGGRAGRRKLIGLRGKNNQNDRALSLSMINELENFLTWSKELDWLIQSKTRPIAIATITMLKEKFNL